jgi:hypothetical protein
VQAGDHKFYARKPRICQEVKGFDAVSPNAQIPIFASSREITLGQSHTTGKLIGSREGAKGRWGGLLVVSSFLSERRLRGFILIKATKEKRKKVVPFSGTRLPRGTPPFFLFSFAAFMKTKKDNQSHSPKQGGIEQSRRITFCS